MSQVRSYPPSTITDHSVAVYKKSIPDAGHHYQPLNHQNQKEHRSMMTIRGGPPLSNTRTSLPQIQSKFDLEPNPFEQSFKDNPTESAHHPQPNTNSPSLDHLLNGSRSRKARSSSPPHFSSENRLSPPVIRHTPGGSVVKVSLPGINSIASPAILVHHTGTSTPKSLSPPTLSTSHSAQSSLPVSMPPYNWNFGGLGDSLRAGPLSPALLNGPAPARAGNPVSHTGLTPLIDIDNNNNGNGTITPGTQALIALLSGDDQNTNDIPNAVGQPSISSSEVGSSNPTDSNSHNPVNPPLNPANLVDQNTRSTSSTKAPSNPESSSSPSHRSAGPSLNPIDSTSQAISSTLQDHSQSSTSTNHSPSSSSPQTQDQNQTIQATTCSRMAPVSVVSVNDSSTSSPSSSAHPKRESSSNSCIQSSMATSVGPSGVTSLHSVSPLGLTQSTLSAIGPYSCTSTTSRTSFPQPSMPLAIPPVPPIQSTTEIVTPLSPSSTTRNPMNSLLSGSGDRINDQYNTNPLYLLTVAHEASSRMSQLSNHRDPHPHDTMDDATATAAAALTGLGSSGGSRYSSPGPTINPNGTMNTHLINNIHNPQSSLLKHVDDGSSATSPRLSTQRPGTLSDTSSLPPGVILCSDSRGNLLSAHQDSPFGPDASGVHNINGLLPPQASSSGSGSTGPISFQPSYSNHPLGSLVTMNMSTNNNPQQSFPPLAASASKKKGKKRKENAQAAFEDSQKAELQSSPSIADSSAQRGTSKVPRTGRPTHKAKKSKKSKSDDVSGDDSDSRDGYWGAEEDKAYMKHQGGDDGDFGGYPGHTQMPSNYDPDHPPPTAQPSASGKPETEEEKRKNFLERNRQAALKCRQRKKAWLANLQTKVEYLSTENESLQLTINQLREEIDSFRSILVSHKDCPITVGGGRGASTTIGELVGREPGLVAASAAAILAQQHHNGTRAVLRHPQAQNAIHPSVVVTGTLAPSNGSIAPTHHTSHGAVASSYGY
ncbi:hypothetical protein PGT21_006040 [Puccinia graminis f. sp. tritici]|uniref:BZIP domain-containing protein n=1 Tax=Puccinia graminis f. sp. tritici TaxID=56615 RepID=A0A5B0SCJ1_PUCGR|nr:hypothetical protein PGT21_006040 [Puccinia graminis f. sp. tritici]KAA1135557.1 hypothetical protein PGTUg99_018113 [Puccinia graminis f. sp. tritici]